MSKNQNIWTWVLVALAIGGFIWAMDERSKRLKAENNLKRKKEDYLELLQQFFEIRKDVPAEVKEQLYRLREEYESINDVIASRLRQVSRMLANGDEQVAIEKLTQIIEDLLKERYVKEGLAKDKTSCPSLYRLLKKAKELKWIGEHHFHFSLFLKKKRNEEVHEADASFTENDKALSFFSGLEVIYCLRGIKRKVVAK